jgi:hypothetical protein
VKIICCREPGCYPIGSNYVTRRGDEEYFGDQVILKRGDGQCFSDHMVNEKRR